MVQRRASDKNIRALIAKVEAGGWTVADPAGKSNIYKAKCPCGSIWNTSTRRLRVPTTRRTSWLTCGVLVGKDRMTMRYDVEFFGEVVDASGSTRPEPDLETFVDRFVAELDQLEAQDIDVSTDLVAGTIRVAVSVAAHDLLTAQEKGSTQIRTAFHAAGATTPSWSIDWMKASTMPDLPPADLGVT